MTVKEECRISAVEESGLFGVSLGLLKTNAVARRLFLGCLSRCHVDEHVVAVFAGEHQHHPVALPVTTSGINRNHLTEICTGAQIMSEFALKSVTTGHKPFLCVAVGWLYDRPKLTLGLRSIEHKKHQLKPRTFQSVRYSFGVWH